MITSRTVRQMLNFAHSRFDCDFVLLIDLRCLLSWQVMFRLFRTRSAASSRSALHLKHCSARGWLVNSSPLIRCAASNSLHSAAGKPAVLAAFLMLHLAHLLIPRACCVICSFSTTDCRSATCTRCSSCTSRTLPS